MRVGRAALDEDAIRLIEQHNPELTFDWTQILKGQGSEPDYPQERRGKPRRPDGPPRDPRGPRPAPPAREPERSAAPEVEPSAEEPAAPMLEPEAPDAEPVPVTDEVQTAALARLGSEGLSRLRARHAEILARISEQVPEPSQRDELKSQADRLNPDTWVTDAEVTQGIEQYEAVLESFRSVIGRRRRRRGRPDGAPPAEVAGEPAAEDTPEPELGPDSGGADEGA